LPKSNRKINGCFSILFFGGKDCVRMILFQEASATRSALNNRKEQVYGL